MTQQTKQGKQFDNFYFVSCRSFPLQTREDKCLKKILGQNYEQMWRLCRTSGDGFCLFNSATDFMNQPAYGSRSTQLKQHLTTAYRLWKQDPQNKIFASAFQQKGIPDLINQIQPNVRDTGSELVVLLPFPPFNMNYILIQNVKLAHNPFIVFLSTNQMSQQPFDQVYTAFSKWVKEKYPNKDPLAKQVVMSYILDQKDTPWKRSMVIDGTRQQRLIYTKQALQQYFPSYTCDVQMNTETFNPDLPTLIFFLSEGIINHFSRLECKSIQEKVDFIRRQYQEKTKQSLSNEMFGRMMNAEKKRLNFFGNKMAPSPQDNNKNNAPQQTDKGAVVIPQISRNQTPQQIGTDAYLKHLLVVINGFLLGILKKDQKFYDIHNKEEAKRLLSTFHNDYKKQQKTFSATTNNELRDLYDNAMKTLANLEAIDRYKVEMRLAQSDAKKQQIRKNIIKLQQLIPQAYKNDSIPLAGGGITSLFNNLWAPSQQQQQGQPKPQQAAYEIKLKQFQMAGTNYRNLLTEMKNQYQDLQKKKETLSQQQFSQEFNKLNKKKDDFNKMRQDLKTKSAQLLQMGLPPDVQATLRKQVQQLQKLANQ